MRLALYRSRPAGSMPLVRVLTPMQTRHVGRMLSRAMRTGAWALVGSMLLMGSALAQDIAVRGFSATVPARAQGDSPAAARDTAMADAERKALDAILTEQGAPAGLADSLDRARIGPLVEGVEVRNERMTDTAYAAELVVSFRESGIRALLGGVGGAAGMAPPMPPAMPPSWMTEGAAEAHAAAEAAPLSNPGMQFAHGMPAPHSPAGSPTHSVAAPRAGGPVLVVPVWREADGVYMIWEDENPWKQAWNAGPAEALRPAATLPLGDLSDIRAGTVDALLSGQWAQVAELAQHYGAGSVVVSEAWIRRSPGGLPEALHTQHTRITPTGTTAARADYPLTSPLGEERDTRSTLAEAAAQSAEAVRAASGGTGLAADSGGVSAAPTGAAYAADATPAHTLEAVIRFSDLREWQLIRTRLAGTPGVRSVVPAAMSSGKVDVQVGHDIPRARLLAAMESQGIRSVPAANGQVMLSLNP